MLTLRVSPHLGKTTASVLNTRYVVEFILLDIQMPQKNGIETLRTIRAMKGREDIPVIMLTGVEDKDFVLESAKLGICDYILKPFYSEDLIKRICRVFEKEEEDSKKREEEDRMNREKRQEAIR